MLLVLRCCVYVFCHALRAVFFDLGSVVLLCKNKAVPIAALMLPVITFFLVGPCYAVAKLGAPEVIFVYWMKAFALFCIAQAVAVVF